MMLWYLSKMHEMSRFNCYSDITKYIINWIYDGCILTYRFTNVKSITAVVQLKSFIDEIKVQWKVIFYERC